MLPGEQTDVSVIKSLIISISRYRQGDKLVSMEESVQSMGKVSRFANRIDAVSPGLSLSLLYVILKLFRDFVSHNNVTLLNRTSQFAIFVLKFTVLYCGFTCIRNAFKNTLHRRKTVRFLRDDMFFRRWSSFLFESIF